MKVSVSKVKVSVVLALVLALAACDSQSSEPSAPAAKGQAAAKVPGKKEVAKEVATGVKDVLANKGPKWKIDYSGDLKGHVEGGILTAMSVASSTTAVGAAMTADKKAKAPEGFRLTILNAKTDKAMPMLNLTLADGTKCTADPRTDGPAKMKIHDPEGKTFHADISGKLKCGDAKDKSIDFTAVLKK